MKLIVSKSALEDCVKNLVRVINPKNAMPILGDILFEVNQKAMTAHLTASDGEVTMIYEVVLVECEGEGRFCVSARLLADMLGTSRANTSRLLTNMTEQALIRHEKKRIIIRDMASLSHFYQTGL